VLWFLALLVCLLVLKRWLSRHLYGLGLLLTGKHDIAVLVYFLLLFPGVLVHELSHWLAAKLLRVPTGRISIGPTRKGSGATRFGSVSVGRTDPLRGSLIGLAPLLTGTILILVIAHLVFGLAAPEGLAIDLGAEEMARTLWGYLAVPNLWLWVYLIFSISNAMLPSVTDRQAWSSLALYCILAIVVLYGLGLLQQVPYEISIPFLNALNYLSFAFLVTIVVDGAVIVVVFLLERVVIVLTGRRVEY
jgi:hypothetical protein